jgi:ABC-2 type transport system permease protein
MNRAFSLTAVKDMLLWAFTGELIPLDLFPEPLRGVMMHSPFASGAYIPIAYITGRIGGDLVVQSFVSITAGLVCAGAVGYLLWTNGMKSYTGTGA